MAEDVRDFQPVTMTTRAQLRDSLLAYWFAEPPVSIERARTEIERQVAQMVLVQRNAVLVYPP